MTFTKEGGIALKLFIFLLFFIVSFGSLAGTSDQRAYGAHGEDSIVASLDSPANNTSVAGIETIHGWAFASSGAPVSVFLRLNGITDYDYPLPCCGPRRDVQQDVEGAPLDTSYSGVVNYANLAHLGAGEHTVGVEIQADGHESVIIEHTIMVALPGDIEFNPTFSFEDAWTGVDRRNDQVLIINATTGAELGAANLRVDYSLPTQNTSIVEAYNESATTDADLDAVQDIFEARRLPCHSDESDTGHAAGGLDLTAGTMPWNTVAVPSHQVSDGTLLVNPGYPDESYLVEKLLDAPRAGLRMPRDMPPLSEEEIEIIRHWVGRGALVPSDFASGQDEDDDHGHEPAS